MDRKQILKNKKPARLLRGTNKLNLALVGFKGCGKSTVGVALAQMLEAPFIDLDRRIEEKHKKKLGESLSCRDIFKKHGEAYFREIERKALQQALRSNVGAVVALGGGSADNNKELLIKCSGLTIVFIYTRPKILFSRIMANGMPPFFDKNDPLGSFLKLYRKRLKTYKEVADFVVDNSKKHHHQVAREIIDQIEARSFRG